MKQHGKKKNYKDVLLMISSSSCDAPFVHVLLLSFHVFLPKLRFSPGSKSADSIL